MALGRFKKTGGLISGIVNLVTGNSAQKQQEEEQRQMEEQQRQQEQQEQLQLQQQTKLAHQPVLLV